MLPRLPRRITRTRVRIDLSYGQSALLAICLSLACVACAGQDIAPDEFSINRPTSELQGAWAVFIEAHDAESGLGADGFGDVVLFNLGTKEKTYITRDSYLDDNPCLSPDGKRLAFTSARIGRPELVRVTGLAARRGLFVANFSLGTARRLGENVANENPSDWFYFHGLSWSRTATALYYLSSDSVVFVLSTPSESLFVFASCPGAESVKELSVSDTDSLFAVVYSTVPADSFWIIRSGLSVYDAFHDEWTQMIGERHGLIEIGGWAPDSRSFLVMTWESMQGRLWRYDVERRVKDAIVLPTEEWKLLEVEPPYFESPSSLVFLASYMGLDAESATPEERKDLFRFNLQEDRLERLTTDGIAKSSLQVTIVR